MKSIRILAVLLSIGLLAVGCSQETEITAPDAQTQLTYDKNGTETLGPPTIRIATGSCFAQGGVGMVGVDVGTLVIDVPTGAAINQVLVYWAGGTTGAPGDNTVKIDGNDVTGELIGGPTNFFSNYWFSAYRADITSMGLVVNGPNSFEITEFDFDYTGGTLDENNGIGMLVIYDDGTLAEISLLDGLDMAYFDFTPTLDATVPQTFTFAAESADRIGRMVIFAGSVGVGRPNSIKLTTSAGDDVRDNLLGSDDGLLWDTLCLTDILIPAGDTSVTVELISTITALDPIEDRGASMAWVGAGFSIPVTTVEEIGCRVTGGGHGDFLLDGGEVNTYQGSGQVGARSSMESMLRGEWTHKQKSGPAGKFTFRAGHPSAPKETEISWIECSDPDGCDPSHMSPVKQVDFAGIGNFNNLFDAPAEIADHVEVHESLHWFEVNIDDLGEPGNKEPVTEGCDPLGFGRNGDTELADCDCPDFYRIRIYEGEDASSNIMYEVYGYINGGNFNTHRATGYDRIHFK